MLHTAISKGEIFVIESDADTRETLSGALRSQGYDVICFANGAALLPFAKARIPACVIVDIRLPEKHGMDILKTLQANNYPAPIIATSAHADIPMAVEALRSGAIDFIEKPLPGGEANDFVNAVIERLPCSAGHACSDSSLQFSGQKLLTPREHAVLECLVSGASNREAAQRLGLSTRTVEGHRSNVMKKLGARNTADLIRTVFGTS